MKTRLFQDAVLTHAGVPLKSRAAQLYRGSLKPDPDPYANLIGITIRAESVAQARTLATATVAQLQALHGQTNTAALALAKTRLRGLDEDLRVATASRARSCSSSWATRRLMAKPRLRRCWPASCLPTATPPSAP